ncbi:Leucine-rich repeat-containing N-terminal, plant-type [Dillenia turbinata]|uniref:Leucine-rich repeat-containing N-terminal, plant-type n=1 Tax=Dillenia turbinata TaxID=194707 RepID=A0AAN8YY79_9MAGN
MDSLRLKRIFLGLTIIVSATFCVGLTDPRDVHAINGLYDALGRPPLQGWESPGGDPCLDAWQGVQCVNANITAIALVGADLGGELGSTLGDFVSIIVINLSNNHIGGTVPNDLPPTLRSLFLSANELNGSIPDILSTLGQLTDMSLNNNHLTGSIPDSFQSLTTLMNLDLSGNNLSGQLPPSMSNLSSITSLHLQNNQLSGYLDVLQDLPLLDLNIENNLFWGPIPDKLLTIPNFRKEGNPFNTTVLPSPSITPPPSPLPVSPSPKVAPGPIAKPPYLPWQPIPDSTGEGSFFTMKRIIWIAIAGVLVLSALVLVPSLYLTACCKKNKVKSDVGTRHGMNAMLAPLEETKHREDLDKSDLEKTSEEAVARSQSGFGGGGRQTDTYLEAGADLDIAVRKRVVNSKLNDDCKIDIPDTDVNFMRPPPPASSVEKVGVTSTELMKDPSSQFSKKILHPLSTLRSFSVASLQQYTNSFSQENLIGSGMLGSVYRAALPDGKLLVVKKLGMSASRLQSDEEFLELVAGISKLKHANIVKITGHCCEHGQRLLVYEYYRNGTLYDALHFDDEIHSKLSWDVRIHMAIGAARVLEYLHEVCQQPIVHKNFKSANILLDDKLGVFVSECGLAPLIPSGPISQLSGHTSAYGYAAPELETGSYTCKSDVYSFGVVMLELLTGRKSYDRSRLRGEQYLVRWAVPQLHDIEALSRMVDPSLNGSYPSKSLSRFVDILSLCLQPEPEFRPPMSEIVQCLSDMIQRGT